MSLWKIVTLGAVALLGCDRSPSAAGGSDAAAARLAELERKVSSLEARLAARSQGHCPLGYQRDQAQSDLVACTRGRDEMVKVGDFWLDRYEASAWARADCSGVQFGVSEPDYPSGFPSNGNASQRVYACSVADVTPSASLTWFQAVQACAASAVPYTGFCGASQRLQPQIVDQH